MKKIFEPVKLGKLELKNRILRGAALTDKDGANGCFLPYEKQVCAELAKNNVAAIITGMMGVGTNSCAADMMVKTYIDGFHDSFKEICDATHENGGKLIAQISHCGANSMVFEEGENPWAPSDITSMMGFEAKEMTKDQIARVVKDFGTAAAACKEAGADAVELHCAHAYLLSQFLSPYYNKRRDEYGGAIENRARAVLEAYDSVRLAVGPDYPVLVKINFDDLIGEEGLQGDECVWVCKELDRRGVDAIEVSSGLALTRESRPMQKAPEGLEGNFTQGALKVAEAVSCAVISVGGYRTEEQVSHSLNLGKIEAIAICRPLADPAYIADWK